MDQQVKRVKRELIKHGAILDMYEDTMELPDGKQETWDFISHRKGAAAVVPVRGDGKILMVKQYRNAIDRMTLEIPAGSRDSVTEDTRVCAARELEEETGVKGLPVEQFACYGDYQRDPRARVITTAYFSLVNEKEVRVKAGDDAADAAWFTVKLKKGESKDITTDAAVIRREDFSLELENEDRGLKIRAVICKEERQGLVRERKYKVKEGGMVAVDHAAILTQALEVIQQRIRKNSCTCG